MTTYESEASGTRLQAASQPFWRRFWPFGDAVNPRIVASLYVQAVNRARVPQDYVDFGLLDTEDNRREWLGCWSALVMIRLYRAGANGPAWSQAMFDYAFADLEGNFRERGVSDMSMERQVKKSAATFLARYKLIEATIDGGPIEALVAGLEKHMAFTKSGPAAAQACASTLLGAYKRLQAQSDADILGGRLDLDG